MECVGRRRKKNIRTLRQGNQQKRPPLLGMSKSSRVRNLTLSCVVTDDRKCNAEIQMCISITKDGFQKLSKVSKSWKMSLETKKSVLNC